MAGGHSAGRVDEAALLGQGQHHQRDAADGGADAAVPRGGHVLGEIAGVALDDGGAGQDAAQVLGHVRLDLDHEQAAGGRAGIEQCAGDDAGAGTEFGTASAEARVVWRTNGILRCYTFVAFGERRSDGEPIRADAAGQPRVWCGSADCGEESAGHRAWGRGMASSRIVT